MGSKERIQRIKEETRSNILDAALQIVKEDGWQALSMRKIAEKIEYTAPIIYEYFANKEGILLELTRIGHVLLLKDIKQAKIAHEEPADQLAAMWVSYWDFAFAQPQLYQLMYGVDMMCCELKNALPEAVATSSLINEAISSLLKNPTQDMICRKYYTFWSVIHGLISITMVRKGADDEMNQHILNGAIQGIIKTIND